jgi:signal transduction histidine kinase
MGINPFRWLNAHPRVRVLGGWFSLLVLVLVSLFGGQAIPIGPIYALPVILISYDIKLARGLLIAVVAGLTWTIFATNIGTSLWEVWNPLQPSGSRAVSAQVAQADGNAALAAPDDDTATTRRRIEKKWGSVETFTDPMQQIPLILSIWAMGTLGFVLVAVGFHTIRSQEFELAKAEQERLKREKEILNAISMTLNHEINNPLAIIAGQVGLMEMAGGKESAHAKSIQNIQHAVTRISNFVKELSDIEELRVKTVGTSFQHVDWESAKHPDKTPSTQAASVAPDSKNK